MRKGRVRGGGWRLAALVGFVLAAILVPFALFEDQFAALSSRLIAPEGGTPRAAIGLLVVALLALDVLLPIPSSVVAVAAGASLGGSAATAVNWLGLMSGVLIGYSLGWLGGAPLARRLVGPEAEQRARAALGRNAVAFIALSRAVPVAAEASVILAGTLRLAPARVLGTAALANLGTAAVYAAVGALTLGIDFFLLAFAGSVLVPALGWLALRARDRRASVTAE